MDYLKTSTKEVYHGKKYQKAPKNSIYIYI